MIHHRSWRDKRHAVGLVAAYARLALPYYTGGRPERLVRAVEFAEACSRGESVSEDDAMQAYADASTAGAATSTPDWHVGWCAAYAVGAIHARDSTTIHFDSVTRSLWHLGVELEVVYTLLVTWWAKDVGVEFRTDEERRAVLAALAAGDEATARHVMS
jgi:hypothetical protein